MRRGRPTDYVPEIAAAIADLMLDGNSLRTVCQQPGMPNEGTVYRWIARHPEFREQYARARELQAMRWADEILSIADNGKLDPQDRRVRVDTRKWLLSKVLPKVYGDKITVSGDPDAPLRHVVEIEEAIATLSEPELAALECFTKAVAAAREGTIVGDGEDFPGNSAIADRKRGK